MLRQRANGLAPGIRQLLPLPVGAPARFRRDPLAFLVEARRTYGDLFRFQVGPYVMHLVAHPDDLAQVLLVRQKNYPRSWISDRTKVGAGEVLFTTEGAPWRRLRRMAQPAFHPARVAAQAEMITGATSAMLARWREHARSGGGPLDVADEFMSLTLRIAGLAFLGIDLEGESARVVPAVTAAVEE
jgi:cytochrome P450